MEKRSFRSTVSETVSGIGTRVLKYISHVRERISQVMIIIYFSGAVFQKQAEQVRIEILSLSISERNSE